MQSSLFNNVFSVRNLNIVNAHKLLWGDDKLSYTVNDHLLFLVHIFIKKKIPKDLDDVIAFVSKRANWNLIVNYFESFYTDKYEKLYGA